MRPHPFALPHQALREAVDALTGSLAGASAEPGSLTLRLPSTATGPLPSPELILEDERADAPPSGLMPWDVASLTLDPSLALDWLLSLPTQPPHGTAYGSALRFWTEAAKLSLELVVRQSAVPTVRETTQGKRPVYRATWDAVLADDDLARIHQLAQAMPPVCRAYAIPDGPAPQPQDLVVSFLHHTVDAFVRQSVASTSLLPPRRGRRPQQTPVAEQWLQALTADDPTLSAPAGEVKKFAETLHAWLSQVQPADSTAPFRTCFRLEPPEDEDRRQAVWGLSFHLQAADDRSLLVPAERVWKERSSTLTLLTRRFENPQERLLADLGKASRLFPAIEDSLNTARPTGLTLTIEQAYTFLRQSAPLLEQSGFGVLLPAWWQKPAARLGVMLTLKPKTRKTSAAASSGLLGLDGIVAYDWQVALGDERLSLREFEQLARLKVPLVKVRGQWVELRPEELETALAFFKKRHGDGEMTLGTALRLGVGQGTSDPGLPILGIDGEGWVKSLLDTLAHTATMAPIDVPAAFRGVLRPYQLRGVSWLAFLRQFGFGACLADDMGLGKTVMFLALLLSERAKAGKKPGPVLLVCPMSIVGNWQREAARFAPSLKVMVHHGLERLSGRAFAKAARQHDLVLTTYALAHRDEQPLSAVDWEWAVLDEAQNIKNPSTKQTQAIRRLRARSRVALTGTPVENRLSELWSIMEFLNPGYLGSASEFRTRFALPIEKYRNTDRAMVLKRLIQPFVLRRVKTDPTIINDLPSKLEMKVFCNLTQEQATLYEAVVKDMMEQIEEAEGIERRGLVLATLMKLKQVCNHPAHFVKDNSALSGRSGKLARLEEMADEVLAEGDKALIFTQFAEMGGLLRRHLQEVLGCEVLFLHGGTSKAQRDGMIERFQGERRGPPVFILSLKAGGVGLNLTAANHVFHFDRWWNPAVENQATDRVFRIGQRKNVQVHKFICAGTLEERIDQMIEQKKELADRIVGSGEAWLTEMSTEQLKELFALSREAVGE